LGVASYSLGEYSQAIECYHKNLIITRDIGDGNGEGTALSNLGITYKSLGDYSQAIYYSQQSLIIFQKIGVSQR
jgi:tetratricopeptide (TPR) repeat protein